MIVGYWYVKKKKPEDERGREGRTVSMLYISMQESKKK